MKWESGAFETLPAEPGHQRAITKSAEALVLEFSQTPDPSIAGKEVEHRKFLERMTVLAYEGAEFVVSTPADHGAAMVGERKTWNLSLRSQIRPGKSRNSWGERLGAGPLACVAGQHIERRVLLLPQTDKTFLVGWPPDRERRAFD
ncbi:MAG: hypothetical protein WDM76_12460 [Limisphaerales bacterium]